MNKHILLLVLIFQVNISFSQVKYTKDRMNNEILDASVENIINMINYPSSEFKFIVENKGYIFMSYDNDCTSYVKGATADNTVHMVTKCGQYLLGISWTCLQSGTTYFTQIMDQIEPYYAGYDKAMKMSYYEISSNKKVYRFYIDRSSDNPCNAENVYCKRVN